MDFFRLWNLTINDLINQQIKNWKTIVFKTSKRVKHRIVMYNSENPYSLCLKRRFLWTSLHGDVVCMSVTLPWDSVYMSLFCRPNGWNTDMNIPKGVKTRVVITVTCVRHARRNLHSLLPFRFQCHWSTEQSSFWHFYDFKMQ